MDKANPFGLYIYHKENGQKLVLKELLQLLRTTSPKKCASFAYIEGQTSLIPHLSLWENVQIQTSGQNWKEIMQSLPADILPLAKILRDPDKKGEEAEPWEKFTVSLIKGLLNASPNLLVDIDENLLPPLLLQNFKKILLTASTNKQIYLASGNTSLWLDSAHSLVSRKGYEFVIESFDQEQIKLHWAS